jgi:hypothetical protein
MASAGYLDRPRSLGSGIQWPKHAGLIEAGHKLEGEGAALLTIPNGFRTSAVDLSPLQTRRPAETIFSNCVRTFLHRLIYTGKVFGTLPLPFYQIVDLATTAASNPNS